MKEKDVEIVNQLGLHARAAARLVKTASAFRSRITVSREGEDVDAKSILGLMMLAAAPGTQLTIRANGDDEERALDAVVSLIAARFDEEQ